MLAFLPRANHRRCGELSPVSHHPTSCLPSFLNLLLIVAEGPLHESDSILNAIRWECTLEALKQLTHQGIVFLAGTTPLYRSLVCSLLPSRS